ncbi:MAG: DUF1893 domain-containing protein [Chloroflexota bacterium]
MYQRLYHEFLGSDDALRVYEGVRPVFTSKQDRLLPLMEYIDKGPVQGPVTVFDRIMGNAAALLVTKINCREVYSPLGSELAVRTLERGGIEYHLDKIVPYIQREDGGMCPMEELSLGKGAEEFYAKMLSRLAGRGGKEPAWKR